MEVATLTATTLGRTTRFDVRSGPPTTIGRSSRCSVRLPDRSVSRVHCQLTFLGGRLVVTDLDSTQGLIYRGEPCAEFELELGDGFHLGQTFVRFEASETELKASGEQVRGTLPTAVTVAPTDAAPTAAPRLPRPAPEFADEVRQRPMRRPASRGKTLAARLTAELIVFSIMFAITVALLLLLNILFGWDIYRLLDGLPGLRRP